MIMVDERKREIYVYDMIGPSWMGMDAGSTMVEALALLGDGPVSVRLNSPGGDVFEGYAMYNAIKRHNGEVTTHNDGLVASAATFPFLAGNVRKVSKLSQTMIHEASTIVAGMADDLMEAADRLIAINQQLAELYADVSGKSVDEILAMMKDETWMDAAQSEAMKFATVDEKTVARNTAIVPQGLYKHTPEAYLKPESRLAVAKSRTVDPSDKLRKERIFQLTGVDLRVE